MCKELLPAAKNKHFVSLIIDFFNLRIKEAKKKNHFAIFGLKHTPS